MPGGISSLIDSWVPAIGKVTSLTTLTVGLLAVIHVWKAESGPSFQHGYGKHQ